MLAFDITLAVLIVVIVLFIVKAVRQTRGQIDHHLRGTDPHRRDDIGRDMIARIREEADRVKCARCGGSTFMLLGTENQYQCESCATTFEGPPHLPDPKP
ncbi:MAG: hypothetical protein ACRD1X_06045 [Vicinamibacteria bacterium]